MRLVAAAMHPHPAELPSRPPRCADPYFLRLREQPWRPDPAYVTSGANGRRLPRTGRPVRLQARRQARRQARAAAREGGGSSTRGSRNRKVCAHTSEWACGGVIGRMQLTPGSRGSGRQSVRQSAHVASHLFSPLVIPPPLMDRSFQHRLQTCRWQCPSSQLLCPSDPWKGCPSELPRVRTRHAPACQSLRHRWFIPRKQQQQRQELWRSMKCGAQSPLGHLPLALRVLAWHSDALAGASNRSRASAL